MEEHALIMRNEEGSKLASPEQMQIWMKQTMGWIGGIAAQNKFVSGTRLLFDDARVVNSKQSGHQRAFWRDQRNHWRIHYRESRFSG